MSVATLAAQPLATVLAVRWEQCSQKIGTLAEAIPESAFERAPVAGLRTCGAVLRHVAFWNQYVASSLAGKPFDDSANELPVSECPHKRSVLDVLARTSREAASALRGQSLALSPETAELMVTFIEHTSEHYGQLAVYARLLGIVPPASRT